MAQGRACLCRWCFAPSQHPGPVQLHAGNPCRTGQPAQVALAQRRSGGCRRTRKPQHARGPELELPGSRRLLQPAERSQATHGCAEPCRPAAARDRRAYANGGSRHGPEQAAGRRSRAANQCFPPGGGPVRNAVPHCAPQPARCAQRLCGTGQRRSVPRRRGERLSQCRGQLPGCQCVPGGLGASRHHGPLARAPQPDPAGGNGGGCKTRTARSRAAGRPADVRIRRGARSGFGTASACIRSAHPDGGTSARSTGYRGGAGSSRS